MKNRIACAANRYGDIIIAGVRHWDGIMRDQVKRLGLSNYGEWEQGFLDRYGYFKTREESLKIAQECGQIIDGCGDKNRNQLFSEDLY